MGILKTILLEQQRLKPVFIDRSDLEARADCPQQGYLRKLHAAEIKTTEILPVVGNINHKIAEEAIKASDMNLQDAAEYFANELPKALGRTDLQPEVIRAGKNLANELRRFGTNRVLLCEEQIARTIFKGTETSPEYIITTKPDLVLATTQANTIIVLDYKTGYKERTNSEARDAFQTYVIAWCLKGKYPQLETIHFFYLETRINSRAYARIEFNRILDGEMTEEMAIHQRILIAADYFKNDFREAWPEQKKCSQCPVVQWCELADDKAKEISKDPKKYLNNYIVLQALCDTKLESMKDYVRDGKVIYGTKERFAFEPSKPKFIPKIFNGEQKDE